MSAISQAKELRQATLESRKPGTITIGSTSYAGGGLVLGPYKEEPNEHGNWRPAQRLKIHIRKTLLATPPVKRETFTCEGHTWKVDEVAGQSPSEIAWIIRGIRWPESPS